MSVAIRVIPCLDVDAGRVVKGVKFQNLRDAGDPVELAQRYDRAGADELTFLDVTASSGNRETTFEVVSRAAEQIFIPLTVGGGVREVSGVDARRTQGGITPSGFEVTTHGGRKGTGMDAIEWAKEAADRGVGEILLNSIDADGTKEGFDLELIRLVRAAVNIPIIASGGAGKPEHFPPAVAAGANAVLAASIFHFGPDSAIADVKQAIRDAGYEVR